MDTTGTKFVVTWSRFAASTVFWIFSSSSRLSVRTRFLLRSMPSPDGSPGSAFRLLAAGGTSWNSQSKCPTNTANHPTLVSTGSHCVESASVKSVTNKFGGFVCSRLTGQRSSFEKLRGTTMEERSVCTCRGGAPCSPCFPADPFCSVCLSNTLSTPAASPCIRFTDKSASKLPMKWEMFSPLARRL